MYCELQRLNQIKFTEHDIQEITQTLNKERELIKTELSKRKSITTWDNTQNLTDLWQSLFAQ